MFVYENMETPPHGKLGGDFVPQYDPVNKWLVMTDGTGRQRGWLRYNIPDLSETYKGFWIRIGFMVVRSPLGATTVRLGDIKLKPGTTITIMIPYSLQRGVTYTVKIIGKANTIAKTEVVG